jgi:hypothetical protein
MPDQLFKDEHARAVADRIDAGACPEGTDLRCDEPRGWPESSRRAGRWELARAERLQAVHVEVDVVTANPSLYRSGCNAGALAVFFQFLTGRCQPTESATTNSSRWIFQR